MGLNYQKSGVNYGLLDPVKKIAQESAKKTGKNLFGSIYSEVELSRGDSAYLLEEKDKYLAFVVEGLGSKNLVADQMEKITGRSYYGQVAFDTVISILMDVASTGAKPVAISSYWAVEDADWFKDPKRTGKFISGWKKACDETGTVWGGGETPVLKNIINKGSIDLAGAAFGIIRPKNRLINESKLKSGDDIIFLASSGVHVNGLTLANKIAEKLARGLATKVNRDESFGEMLLTPSLYYGHIIQELLDKGLDIHYISNITGHGWRKIMRAARPYTYLIDKLPETPRIFKFIKEKADLSDKEMYATFNMGAGLVIMASPRHTAEIIEVSGRHKVKAWKGGTVRQGRKQVIIRPINIRFEARDLNIR